MARFTFICQEQPSGTDHVTNVKSSSLPRHVLDGHVKAVHLQLKPYSCSKCGKRFLNRRNRNKHLGICKGPKEESAVKQEEDEELQPKEDPLQQ